MTPTQDETEQHTQPHYCKCFSISHGLSTHINADNIVWYTVFLKHIAPKNSGILQWVLQTKQNCCKPHSLANHILKVAFEAVCESILLRKCLHKVTSMYGSLWTRALVIQSSPRALAVERYTFRVVAADRTTSSRGEKRAWQQSWSRSSSPRDRGKENSVSERSTLWTHTQNRKVRGQLALHPSPLWKRDN